MLVIYTASIALTLPGRPGVAVKVTTRLRSIWDPAALLFCQMLWLVVFLITSRSRATDSTLSFFVRHDRI